MRYPKVFEVLHDNQISNDTVITVAEYIGGTRDVNGYWHEMAICELYHLDVSEIKYFPSIGCIHLRLAPKVFLPSKDGDKHEAD